CTAFQLCQELGRLPGAMRRNKDLKFICRPAELIVQNDETLFTSSYEKGQSITIPVAHGEGNFYCDYETLASLKANNQIAFTYGSNMNGSDSDIDG
ncbi:phosphoribosylformylglycinamidine synthase subunit PurQ, partial [Bacillus vallismortis]|nr:phosphoribosylformylglycinamidine synthase subunit PurQ [Bacillus vallismortis]